jgi:predicted PurR-regulated permease PerM
MLQTWAQSRNLPVDLSNIVVQMEARLSTQLQTGGERLLTASLGLAGRFFDLVLTMVLTFYLLLHGKQVWDGIFRWLPSQFRLSARQSLRQVFHNYFVGQVALALLMGSSITVAFLLLRVPFGLLFGLMIGLMALVPFGGILMICLVSFLMALQSIGLGLKVLIVAVLIEQVIENGVAPHLIGSFTGLNPVWILVSLLIGGKIGGFLGILVAVPLASFIKVMVDQFTRPMDVADSEVPNAEIS